MGNGTSSQQLLSPRRASIHLVGGSIARRLVRFERLEDRRMLEAVPQLVADIGLIGGDSAPNSFVAVGNTTYFVATDSVQGAELWRTDGTAAGTALVKDINPGSGDSSPSALTAVDGKLYFRANDGSHGAELWMSDGTDLGTVMVLDINSGSCQFVSKQPEECQWYALF